MRFLPRKSVETVFEGEDCFHPAAEVLGSSEAPAAAGHDAADRLPSVGATLIGGVCHAVIDDAVQRDAALRHCQRCEMRNGNGEQRSTSHDVSLLLIGESNFLQVWTPDSCRANQKISASDNLRLSIARFEDELHRRDRRAALAFDRCQTSRFSQPRPRIRHETAPENAARTCSRDDRAARCCRTTAACDGTCSRSWRRAHARRCAAQQ